LYYIFRKFPRLWPIRLTVNAFLHRAEEILNVAVAGTGDAGDLAIVIDRQGGMRMLEPAGWSLPAMCAEFGAAAAYRVERRGRTVRVEGWGGGDRCLLQRELGRTGLPACPGARSTPSADRTDRYLLSALPGPNFLEKYHAV
jgi:hypothetical protein